MNQVVFHILRWWPGLLTLGLLTNPIAVSAQGTTPPASSSGSNPFSAIGVTAPSVGNFSSVGKIITNGFNITIAVASIVFVVLLLIGGVMYLTAAGNDEQSKRAKTLMLDAVIGLVIVVTAWAIGTFVINNLLGLELKTGD